MKLFEILNTILPYKWDDYSQTNSQAGFGEAEFTINHKTYTVLFSVYPKNHKRGLPAHTNIEFGLQPGLMDPAYLTKYNITGTGDQLAVMSTVQAICKDWFKLHPADCITMMAEVPSRKKLYTRMLRMILPNWSIRLDGHHIIAMGP
jgi:hypothetical protein